MDTDWPEFDPKLYRPFFDLSPRPLPRRYRVWVQSAEPRHVRMSHAGRFRELLPMLQQEPINALHKRLKNGEEVALGLMYDWELDDLRTRFEKIGLKLMLRQELVPDPAL